MNFDEAVKDVIRFLDGYACEHYRYYGWHISDDEIFELPWINILINLRILITSHLGSMDRKKLDGMLHDLATRLLVRGLSALAWCFQPIHGVSGGLCRGIDGLVYGVISAWATVFSSPVTSPFMVSSSKTRWT